MPPKFQNPKGTRDFYPADQLRRRYITESWRAVSLRHGFEEIDGPTFEHLSLYTVKSGDEIVSQLFSFQREGGDDTYALRPEFTPTLARMYAARAAQLPRPVRWFCTPTFFRAEKPQRGRLREFGQWNCDVIGDGTPRADTDVIAAVAGLFLDLGLTPDQARIRLSDRDVVQRIMAERCGVSEGNLPAVFALLDRREKLPPEALGEQAASLGFDLATFDRLTSDTEELLAADPALKKLIETLGAAQLDAWCDVDFSIVRGLAYYTGSVFEAIRVGERAICGGGRYDRLVELFDGPPTPAVGFGMGDVVLSNILDDASLMPDDHELPGAVEAVTRSQALRPEVFVVPGSDDENGLVTPLVARLRRGVERAGFEGRPWDPARYDVPPLHARTSDKATRNLKKLLADAEKQRARLAAVVHSPDEVQLKRLDTREEHPDNCSIDPDSPHYLGRVASTLLGRAPTPSA
jgi:histidyl-tRNA synthetase